MWRCQRVPGEVSGDVFHGFVVLMTVGIAVLYYSVISKLLEFDSTSGDERSNFATIDEISIFQSHLFAGE